MGNKPRFVVGFIGCDENEVFEIGTGEGKKKLVGAELVEVLKELAEAGGYEFEYKKKGGQVEK